MSSEKLRYMALHTLGAATFMFVLSYFILNTGLQRAAIWAIAFGAMAFFIARRHMSK